MGKWWARSTFRLDRQVTFDIIYLAAEIRSCLNPVSYRNFITSDGMLGKWPDVSIVSSKDMAPDELI